MRRVCMFSPSLMLAVAACAIAASGPAPGMPGYVAPWNRAATDSVVDLDPGAKGDRFEMSGRLVGPDGVSPMAGLRVYAYHADWRFGYADPNYPELDLRAGVLLSGPGGGYCIRSTMPSPYAGPPHVHMDAELPGKGRCSWFVSFYPDSASWPLPGGNSPNPMTHAADEHRAVLHLGPDRVYRTNRKLHVGDWFPSPGLDSTRAERARKYERAPWRNGVHAKAQGPH